MAKNKTAEEYFESGVSNYKLRKFQEAIADFDEVINLNPKYGKAYIWRGLAKLKLASSLIRKDKLRKLQDAIADFDIGIELEPQYSPAYGNRGLAKFNLGRFDAAIADFDNSIELGSGDRESYFYRGLAKIKLEQFKASTADFDMAIELKPKYIEAYCNRGFANFKLGKYGKAIADSDSAIAINPECSEAYCIRGISKIELGNNKDAVADFDTGISINPEDSKAYYNRAIANFNVGEPILDCIADLDIAIELNPEYSQAYYLRGIYHKGQGNRSFALRDLKKANDLDPTLIAKEATKKLDEKVTENQESIAKSLNLKQILEDNKTSYINRRRVWMWISIVSTCFVFSFLIFLLMLAELSIVFDYWWITLELEVAVGNFYDNLTLKLFVLTINVLFIRQYLNADKMVIASHERLVANNLLFYIRADETEDSKKIKELSYPKLIDIICGVDSKQSKDNNLNVNLAKQILDNINPSNK